MKGTNAFTFLLWFAALGVAAPHAQSAKTVTKEGQITATATIQAIDSTTRTVTLRCRRRVTPRSPPSWPGAG